MKYNFDKVTPRRGTNSCKWDSAENAEVLPMWVADMDFPIAPAILETLHRRVDHGIFGYTHVPDSYYDAVIQWFDRRHEWKINREWILCIASVVPALSMAIKTLTKPGDNVLIQGPVYNHFYSAIENSGRVALSSSLIYSQGTYTIDYDDLEKKAADPQTTIMLLCNPHNPAGRVWKREELVRIGEICLRNGVTVVADEIHCELVMPGYTYTPFASISEEFAQHSVTCVSPSKAFNIAGLQIANIVCANDEIRKKLDCTICCNEMSGLNSFGIEAAQAAYNQCEDWLLELIEYIQANYEYMQEFCKKNLPGITLAKLEGTYLAWMDCSVLGLSSADLEQQLIDKSKLWINAGTMYGIEGESFMRWNLACPRVTLADGLNRFAQFVNNR